MSIAPAIWDCYAQLLLRLNPRVARIVFADAGGRPLWSSDAGAAQALQPSLDALLAAPPGRREPIDGRAVRGSEPGTQFGFRLRGALGEPLGLVAVGGPPGGSLEQDLSAMHELIEPALDCLASELSVRASFGDLRARLAEHDRELGLFARLAQTTSADGPAALARIPDLVNEYLGTSMAAILLPERRSTIWRARDGAADGGETELLARLHGHLMTRAQLHGCTLVANQLCLDGTDAAIPHKALSTPIRDGARRVVGVLAAFRPDSGPDFPARDAETIELLARKAAQILASSFDPLTGLLTQAAFVAQATERLRAPAQGCRSHGLLYVDIDQLSVVNESHGMHVGDEIIQAIGGLVARAAREGALAARVGGDRFALFVPGCGIEPAARIAEELRGAAVRLSGARAARPRCVSLSIGAAGLADPDRRLEHAVAAAEFACRTAKERGRNRVEVFYGNATGSVGGIAASALEAQVSAALAADAFELLAQPILPLTCAPADPRFEVLLRMRAGDGSRVGVEKFTGTAARPELARDIDRWVVERALSQLAQCRDRLRDHPARFSLNLSAASLTDGEFWRFLEERVRTARIPPGTVSFEFTQTACAGAAERLAPYMLRLREQGVTFTLDNVGRGPDALLHLGALPVSCVKIDGGITRRLARHPQSRSTALAITQLAKTFGLETVAAHVETDEIRAEAANLGIDFGQGFLIGKPHPLDQAIRDLPLYSCFATWSGLRDQLPVLAAAAR